MSQAGRLANHEVPTSRLCERWLILITRGRPDGQKQQPIWTSEYDLNMLVA